MAKDPKDRVNVKTANASKESLSGSAARSVRAEVSSTNKETLSGSSKKTVAAQLANTTRESLHGDLFNVVYSKIAGASKEVLAKGPGVYSIEALRETLVSLPNDPTSVDRIVTTVYKEVAQKIDAPPIDEVRSWSFSASVFSLGTQRRNKNPIDDVISWISATSVSVIGAQKTKINWSRSEIDVAVNLSTVSYRNKREWVRSDVFIKKASSYVSIKRDGFDLDVPHGPSYVYAKATLASLSRTREYVPKSGVYSKLNATISAQARSAKDPHGPSYVYSHVILATARRDTPRLIVGTDAWQNNQLVAISKVRSQFEATYNAHSYHALVSTKKDFIDGFSPIISNEADQLVAIKRDTVRLESYAANSLSSLAASARSDVGLPASQAISPLYVQQAASKKHVTNIDDVWSKIRSPQGSQLATITRWTIDLGLLVDPSIGAHILSTRVKYTIERSVVPPEDLGDPDVGVFNYSQGQLVAIKRDYSVKEDASSLSQLVSYPVKRVMPELDIYFDLVAGIAIQKENSYPDKDIQKSNLIASSVNESVALKAEYPDKNKAYSSLISSGSYLQSISPSKSFPDKDSALSRASLDQLIEQAAHPSLYPPKNTNRSKLISDGVFEVVALTDESLVGIPDMSSKRRIRVSISIFYD